MSRDEVLAVVPELVRRELRVAGPIGPESRLVEDLGGASIELLSLATAVEDRFEVMLDESDEAGISTVGDLAELVLAKLTAEGR